MDGVQLPQGYRAVTIRQFTFYHSNGNGLLNIYRKIPLICSMYISPRIYAHPQIGPSNLSSLRNIKFTKNVTFMYFASAIYLPSFSVSGNFA